jgi:hypothetical protein
MALSREKAKTRTVSANSMKRSGCSSESSSGASGTLHLPVDTVADVLRTDSRRLALDASILMRSGPPRLPARVAVAKQFPSATIYVSTA